MTQCMGGKRLKERPDEPGERGDWLSQRNGTALTETAFLARLLALKRLFIAFRYLYNAPPGALGPFLPRVLCPHHS